MRLITLLVGVMTLSACAAGAPTPAANARIQHMSELCSRQGGALVRTIGDSNARGYQCTSGMARPDPWIRPAEAR